MRRFRPAISAFTLVELLVVIGIIAVLIGVLVPVLARARAIARQAACASNLRQIGIAIHAYADSNNGCIPYGPKAPAFTASNFYPTTGSVTSLISLETGAPVGLGLLLDSYLSQSKRVLFCPDPDQSESADFELSKVGVKQAQGDYFYRHASGGDIYWPPGTEHLKLGNLGDNNQGEKIRALAMDANYLAHPSIALFGVQQRTFHSQRRANALYSDGHVDTLDNETGRYTADARAYVYDSFAKILAALENADRQ